MTGLPNPAAFRVVVMVVTGLPNPTALRVVVTSDGTERLVVSGFVVSRGYRLVDGLVFCVRSAVSVSVFAPFVTCFPSPFSHRVYRHNDDDDDR